MDKNNINISKIETFLHGMIDGVVSDNTYVGTLPDTIQSSWNDMCLIDAGNLINDMNAFGSGVVHILLYAKPLSNGSKNVPVMSKLEKALNDVISSNTNPSYQISRRGAYDSFDKERKWHCNIVPLNILIY